MDSNEAAFAWTLDMFPMGEQERISTDEARALTRHVWRFYREGEEPPTIQVVNSNMAHSTRHTIRLPLWAHTKVIVLHEIAHSLAFDRDGTLIDRRHYAHGPLFISLVIDLYVMFLGASSKALLECAVLHGIDCHPEPL